MGDLTDRATQGAEFPKPVCCLAPPLTSSPPSPLLWPASSVVCQGASPSVQVRATVYDCVPGFNLFSPSITAFLFQSIFNALKQISLLPLLVNDKASDLCTTALQAATCFPSCLCWWGPVSRAWPGQGRAIHLCFERNRHVTEGKIIEGPSKIVSGWLTKFGLVTNWLWSIPPPFHSNIMLDKITAGQIFGGWLSFQSQAPQPRPLDLWLVWQV